MSATSARAFRRERTAAKLLGTTRVRRGIGESAPDVLPTQLPCGVSVSVEVKSRIQPLKTVERWLAQAQHYAPHFAPVVLVFAKGQHADQAIVCLRASDFRRIAGLAETTPQVPLPLERSK